MTSDTIGIKSYQSVKPWPLVVYRVVRRLVFNGSKAKVSMTGCSFDLEIVKKWIFLRSKLPSLIRYVFK